MVSREHKWYERFGSGGRIKYYQGDGLDDGEIFFFIIALVRGWDARVIKDLGILEISNEKKMVTHREKRTDIVSVATDLNGREQVEKKSLLFSCFRRWGGGK